MLRTYIKSSDYIEASPKSLNDFSLATQGLPPLETSVYNHFPNRHYDFHQVFYLCGRAQTFIMSHQQKQIINQYQIQKAGTVHNGTVPV